MRFCFSTLGCAERSLDAIAEVARRFGVAAIEWRFVDDRRDALAHLGQAWGDPAALRAHLDRLGLQVAVFDTDHRLGLGGEASLADLEAWAHWADGVGVPLLRVFEGRSSPDEPLEAALDRVAAGVGAWRARRAAAGRRCDICVETHDFLFSAAAILDFQRRLGDAPAGILWDTHHPWHRTGEDPLATWSAIRQHVTHIHFKDGAVGAGPDGKYGYTLPGRGAFPLAPLLRRLDADGYAGWCSLEWERKWHPHLPPIEDALAACRDVIPAA